MCVGKALESRPGRSAGAAPAGTRLSSYSCGSVSVLSRHLLSLVNSQVSE
jgi:hypothetical protein